MKWIINIATPTSSKGIYNWVGCVVHEAVEWPVTIEITKSRTYITTNIMEPSNSQTGEYEQ